MAEAGLRGLPNFGSRGKAEIALRTDWKPEKTEEDVLRQRIKLTWTDDAKPGVPDDKMVGEVNLYLPYFNYRGVYIIQNAKVFLSNGEPTNLEYIRTATTDTCEMCRQDGESWRNIKPREKCCLYADVARGLDTFRRDAASRDPLLCKVCLSYVARNIEDYADHRENTHPIRKAESNPPGDPDPGPVPEPEPAPAPEPVPSLTCCGRAFVNATGLSAHQRSPKHKVA